MKEKVLQILGDLTKEKVYENSKLIEDLGFDSLRLAELWFAIEDEFELDMNPMEFFKLSTTVEDLLKVVAQCIAMRYNGVKDSR